MKYVLRSAAGLGLALMGGVVVACSTAEPDPREEGTPARTNAEPTETRSLEEALVADLQNPSSAFYADEAKHKALLAKALEETPGLRERLETISKTLAASHGVSESNPRLSTSAVPGIRVQDLGAGGAVRPAGAQCAAAVGFGAAYAYAWACRQCTSGETVCAYAYAYAYAYAFAWVCQVAPDCGGNGGGNQDAGAGDASPDASSTDASTPDASDAGIADVVTSDPDADTVRDAEADTKVDTGDASSADGGNR